jgi:hypothetical protein
MGRAKAGSGQDYGMALGQYCVPIAPLVEKRFPAAQAFRAKAGAHDQGDRTS